MTNSVLPRLSPEELAVFEAERREAEHERGPRNAIIASTVHAAFGVADPAVVPDVATFALVLRLGVVVPLVLLALPVTSALHRSGRSGASDLVKASVAVLLVGSLSAVMVATHSPSASAYFSGTLPVMVFFALTLRVRLQVALGALGAMTAAALVGTLGTPVLPGTIQHQVSGIVLGTAALLAVMVVSREADLRRAFLLRSRLRLLVSERDAGLDALRRANDELAQLTELDELTQLPNRRALVNRLHQWDTTATWGAVVMVDVDHFKSVNDLHGHATGDACLRAVARALASAAHECGGFVARYGGEEFALLLPHQGVLTAELCVQNLRRAVGACEVEGLRVTASAGWTATRPGDLVPSAVLLERADAAVLAAKAAGRDREMAWDARSTAPSAV